MKKVLKFYCHTAKYFFLNNVIDMYHVVLP